MGKKLRTPLIYLAIVVLMIVLLTQLQNGGTDDKKIEYADFLAMAKEGTVEAVEYCNGEIVGIKKGSAYKDLFPKKYDFICNVSNENAFRSDMAAIVADAKGIDADKVTPEDYPFTYTYNPPPEPSILEYILPYVIMLVIIVVFYVVVFRAQGGGNKMMSFGKAHARTQMDPNNRVTFDDVAGAGEEKEELKEVVEFMRAPKRFTEMGARIPKGVLLVGPPGTGKTLLAKAVAGEAKVPFFSISGSDFVEMFVGVGASRVRDLFTTAKKCAPAVVFIDEIDAVGRQRGAGLGGGHDEREQTLNQLLVEMDGFGANEGIIMIAATNRPDILDPALLRPGRFDRQIVVDRPDIKGRREILKVHVKGKPVGSDVELDVIARRTPGFTGADLSNLVNEAALMAARRNKKQINMPDMEEAAERVIMGPERRSRVISDNEKRLTAYHEGGHTLVGMLLDNADPVHKVTIIPRGRAGGYTLSLPKEDRYYATRSEMLDELKVLLGGRVAEALVLKEISSGASNDLQRATSLARQMICEYGMSTELGPVTFGHRQDQVFLGRDIARDKNYSEEIAAKIDKEIRKFLDEAYQKTEELLQNNIDKLHLIAQALIEKETLEGSEIEQLMKYGRILDKNEQPPDDNSGTPAVIPPDAVTVPAAEAQPQAAPQYQEVPGVVSTEEKHALN